MKKLKKIVRDVQQQYTDKLSASKSFGFHKALIVAICSQLAVPISFASQNSTNQSSPVDQAHVPAVSLADDLLMMDEVAKDILHDQESKQRYQQLMTNEEMKEVLQEFEASNDAFKHAKNGEFPSKMEDPFFLTKQSIRYNDTTVPLSSDSKALPEVKVAAGQMTSAIGVDGSVSLVYETKALYAAQKIEDLNAVKIIEDSELILVFSKEHAYAIDKALAYSEFFTGPIPVHDLGGIYTNAAGESYVDSIADLESLEMKFLTRGLKPAKGDQTKRPDSSYTAGDIAILNSERAIIQILSRTDIVELIHLNNRILAELILGNLQALANSDIAGLLEHSEHEYAELLKQTEGIKDSMSDDAQEILGNFGGEKIINLLTRSVVEHPIRDKFASFEWERDYYKLSAMTDELAAKYRKEGATGKAEALEKAAKEGDLRVFWRDLAESSHDALDKMVANKIQSLSSKQCKVTLGVENCESALAKLQKIYAQKSYDDIWEDPSLLLDMSEYQGTAPKLRRDYDKFLSGKNLRTVGMVGAGTLALSAGVYWRHQLLLGAQKVLPILAKEGYLKQLIPFGLVASSFVGMFYLTGKLVNYIKGETDWSFTQGAVWLGNRVLAFIVVPFWHHIANALGQGSFWNAAKNKINPLKEISALDPVGQAIGLSGDEAIRVGVNKPFLNKTEKAIRKSQQTQAMAEINSQKAHARRIGWELAARIMLETSESSAKDMYGNVTKVDKELLFKEISDENFKAQWIRLANGFSWKAYEFYEKGKIDSLKFFSAAKLRRLLEKALVDEGVGISNADLRFQWAKAVENTSSFVATYSMGSAEFLKTVDPDKIVGTLWWQQFWTDALTMIIITPLHGEFADINRLDKLAVKDSFPFASDEFLNFWGRQMLAYGFAAPSQVTLVYQLNKKVKEKTYLPIEMTTLKGTKYKDSYVQGAKRWASSASELKEINYGEIAWNERLVFYKTLQAQFFLTTVAYMIITLISKKKAGEPFYFLQALNGSLKTTLVGRAVGYYFYAWPWTVIGGGSNHNSIKTDSRNAALAQIKAQLGQSLRYGEEAKAIEYAEHLASLYTEYSDAIGRDPLTPMEEVISEVEMNSLESEEEKSKISFNSPDRVIKGAALYRDYFDGQNMEETLKSFLTADDQNLQVTVSDAKAMLDYSLEHSPFVSENNGAVDSHAFLIGAVITTVLGFTYEMKMLKFNKAPKSWGIVGGLTVASLAGLAFLRYALSPKGIDAFQNATNATSEVVIKHVLKLEKFEKKLLEQIKTRAKNLAKPKLLPAE